MRKIFTLIFAIIAFFATTYYVKGENLLYTKIEMETLLKEIDNYENKLVSVRGVISVSSKLMILKLNKSEASNRNNILKLDVSEISKELCFVSGEFVDIHGKVKRLINNENQKDISASYILTEISRIRYNGNTVYPKSKIEQNNLVTDMIEIGVTGKTIVMNE